MAYPVATLNSYEFDQTLSDLATLGDAGHEILEISRYAYSPHYYPTAQAQPTLLFRIYQALFGEGEASIASFVGNFLRHHEELLDESLSDLAIIGLRKLEKRFRATELADYIFSTVHEIEVAKIETLQAEAEDSVRRANEEVVAAEEDLRETKNEKAQLLDELEDLRSTIASEEERKELVTGEVEELEQKRDNISESIQTTLDGIRLEGEHKAQLRYAEVLKEANIISATKIARADAYFEEVILKARLEQKQILSDAILQFPKHSVGHARLLEREEDHDLFLKCRENTIVSAHSMFMDSYTLFSPDNLRFYKEGVNPNEPLTIPMEQFSADAVALLVRYTYGADPFEQVSGELLSELLYLAQYVGAVDLIRQCEELICENIDEIPTAVSFLTHDVQEIGKVHRHCLSLIADQFSELLSSDDVLTLTPNFLHLLFSTRVVDVKLEENVWMLMKRWAEAQSKAHNIPVQDLLSHSLENEGHWPFLKPPIPLYKSILFELFDHEEFADEVVGVLPKEVTDQWLPYFKGASNSYPGDSERKQARRIESADLIQANGALSTLEVRIGKLAKQLEFSELNQCLWRSPDFTIQGRTCSFRWYLDEVEVGEDSDSEDEENASNPGPMQERWSLLFSVRAIESEDDSESEEEVSFNTNLTFEVQFPLINVQYLENGAAEWDEELVANLNSNNLITHSSDVGPQTYRLLSGSKEQLLQKTSDGGTLFMNIKIHT